MAVKIIDLIDETPGDFDLLGAATLGDVLKIDSFSSALFLYLANYIESKCSHFASIQNQGNTTDLYHFKGTHGWYNY